MSENKEMTFKWRNYFIGEIIEASIYTLLLMFLYLVFDLSPWLLLIIVFLWTFVIYECFHRKSNVTINSSGILIDSKSIKWENIDAVNINTVRGSNALELTIVKKNGITHMFCFFPLIFNKNSLMVDYKIRELSGDRVHPKACFWIRCFHYPICKCVNSLFNKNQKKQLNF